MRDVAANNGTVGPARWLWVVPASLVAGLALAFWFHVPLWLGLVFASLSAALHAKLHHATLRAIAAAAWRGLKRLLRVSLVLLLIGVVAALWMSDGSIPYMTSLGESHIHPDNLLWVSFVLSAILSMVMGSCIATWSVLGPPLMALVPPELAPWCAGALISGGMVGDRSSPMSSGVALMSTAVRMPLGRALSQLNRTVWLPAVVTAAMFCIVDRIYSAGWHAVAPSTFASTASWTSLLLPGMVIVLSLCRVPLLCNLTIAVGLGFTYAAVTSHVTTCAVLQGTWRGVVSTSAHVHTTVGGVVPMASAVLLVLFAGVFQGLAALTGSFERLSKGWFHRVRRPVPTLLSAYLFCGLFAATMGSQMLAILMSSDTLREEFESRGLSQAILLQVVADAAELLPSLIPWNLVGLKAHVILQTPSGQVVQFAWFIYITIAFSMVINIRRLRRRIRCGGQMRSANATADAETAR